MSADTALATLTASFSGNAKRVSSDLLATFLSANAPKAQAAAVKLAAANAGVADSLPYLTDATGRVGVVITAIDPNALLSKLSSLGVVVAASLPKYHRIEGFLPLSVLATVSNLTGGLLGISPVYQPKTNTGSVESQADNILEADRTRASVPGYNGAGTKIGVLSDSYNKYTTSPASASISSGNLPSNVNVLQDYTGSATDEGRAMLELIYDVAPGADLGFATADISEAGFASNIRALNNAGYKIIVDDVAYYDEPFFQDGIVAQAVNDVVASGAAYFSAAGNEGNLSYDTGAAAAYGSSALNFPSQTISPISSSASTYLDWNSAAGTVDTQMSITIPKGSTVYENFEWDQPFYTTNGVTTNLDFYLLSTNTSTGVQTLRASSITNNVTTQTPESLLSYTNSLTGTSATTTFNLVVRNTNGGPIPGRIKFIDENGDSAVKYNEYFTYSSTIVGHAAAASGMAVGAAPYYNQTTPESFSSTGPTTILFNADGTRKAAAEVRSEPAFLSIDGSDTSFFYPGEDDEGNGLYNFFGTSAAAPNAAAVAALVMQANPSFTPAQLYARLKSTADLSNLSTTDPTVVGAGLINAYRAVFGAPVAASAPLADGFESGALGRDWQVNKQGSGLVQVTTALSPATGADQLVLGQNIGFGTTSFALPGLAESTLHVNLAGQQGVSLSFSEKKFASETENAMPASFVGHGNYDGVSFSVDGSTWYRLVSLTGAASTTTYQSESVNISSVAASLGVTLSADTQIKFQEYNATAFAIGTSGIAIDNVSVTPATPPTVTASSFNYAAYPYTVSFTFSKDVSASLSSSDLTVTNLGTSAAIAATYSGYNAATNTATFTLPTSAPNGNYRAVLAAAGVTDPAGNALTANATVDFFILVGDINRDRKVDVIDLGILSTNWQSQNAVFSQGDLNGDGKVDVVDLGMLSSNWQAVV